MNRLVQAYIDGEKETYKFFIREGIIETSEELISVIENDIYINVSMHVKFDKVDWNKVVSELFE